MTGGRSSNFDQAQEKCKQLSAKLPIIKSKSENSFILGLMKMSEQWVWLGMKRIQGKMVWCDDTPADPSNGASYNAWITNEPSYNVNENCAYLDFNARAWNDDKCNYPAGLGPYVLCQKALM